MSREAFAMLLELQAAIESGRSPRAAVRAWFVAGVDTWARSSSAKPLQEHLGLSRRLRRDWMLSRQRDHLDNALRSFAETRTGSAWDLAADFVDELQRFERRADADPGTSRLNRSLWLAFRVGLPVPRTREHWFLKLKAIVVDGSVTSREDCTMRPDLYDMLSAKTGCKTGCNDEALRGAIRTAYREYNRVLQESGGDQQAAELALTAFVLNFSNAPTAAPPSQEQTMTAPASKQSADPSDIEAAARREWERDPDLRAEFGNSTEGFESFVAYKRATAAGLVKMFGVRK